MIYRFVINAALNHYAMLEGTEHIWERKTLENYTLILLFISKESMPKHGGVPQQFLDN